MNKGEAGWGVCMTDDELEIEQLQAEIEKLRAVIVDLNTAGELEGENLKIVAEIMQQETTAGGDDEG